MPPGGRKLCIAVAVALNGCGFANGTEPGGCADPVLMQTIFTANPDNALSELVTARTQNADSIVVRFGRTTVLDDSTPAFTINGDSVNAGILGLLPGTAYNGQVIAFNRCASTQGEIFSFSTGALPADIPSYSASGLDASRGYVAFAAGNYGIVIDNTGRIVWYHRFTPGPGLNFQPQPNGRYVARPASEPGKQGSFIEIDPFGRTMRNLTCANGLQPRMHDMISRADGSYWLLCDEVRSVDLSSQGYSAQSLVTGTDVQWRNASGELLFGWSPFDHFEVDVSILDGADRSGSAINWTHGNSIDVASDGNVIVSFRNLNEVTKIDAHTGTVLWRMGGTRNDFKFENVDMPAYAHQHGVRSTAPGRVILLDNLGEQSGSRVEQYELNEATKTARMTGSFSSTPGLFALIGGNVQTLPNGHTLASFGNGGSVEEHDASGKLVWKLAGNPGYVFRATRISSLYRPGVGDSR